MCIWEKEIHSSPICLLPAASLSASLAVTLPWNIIDPLLVQPFLKIPLKTVPDIFDLPAWSQPRHSWLGGSYLFTNSALSLAYSLMLAAVSVRSSNCTSVTWIVMLSPPQNETPPQLCKPKVAYSIFAKHLAWEMWAGASAGDWKLRNSWQSWLKCIPWKYFSAENGPFH